MKKIISIVLSLILCLSSFAFCKSYGSSGAKGGSSSSTRSGSTSNSGASSAGRQAQSAPKTVPSKVKVEPPRPKPETPKPNEVKKPESNKVYVETPRSERTVVVERDTSNHNFMWFWLGSQMAHDNVPSTQSSYGDSYRLSLFLCPTLGILIIAVSIIAIVYLIFIKRW